MNDADRKELMDLIAEYGTAAIVEGSAGRIRQFKRIVKHVEAVEAAAIERCAKAARGYSLQAEACVRALLPKEE